MKELYKKLENITLPIFVIIVLIFIVSSSYAERRSSIFHLMSSGNYMRFMEEASKKDDLNLIFSNEGVSLLDYSVLFGSKYTRYLLDNGANPNVISRNGLTYPLHESIKIMDIDVTKALIDYGADVNAIDGMGNTPLSVAGIIGGYCEGIELLIRSNANINHIDSFGKTIIDRIKNKEVDCDIDSLE